MLRMKLYFTLTAMLLVLALSHAITAGTGETKKEGGERELILRRNFVASTGDEKVEIRTPMSVCEDSKKNFYVLDAPAYKVLKFSPQGKYLLSFGQRGEGPGDFIRPYKIYYSDFEPGESGQVIVVDFRNNVSYFSTNGKFLRKLNLNHLKGAISFPVYAGKNLFFAQKNKGGVHHSYRLILFDSRGKTLSTPFFSYERSSIIKKSQSGFIAYGINNSSEFDPNIIYTYNNGFSATGFTRKYEIAIFNHEGKHVATAKRAIRAPVIKPEERKYYEETIDGYKYRKDVSKQLKKSIPKTKNFFKFILINGKYILVFRSMPDVTRPFIHSPIDVFDLKGTYIGTGKLFFLPPPLYLSDDFLYLYWINPDQSFSVQKFSFEIEAKTNR